MAESTAAGNVNPTVPPTEVPREKGPHLTSHLMRITNHGKMNAWVSYALDFLEKNEDTPLILHTLPAPPPSPLEAEPAAPTEGELDHPTKTPKQPKGSLSTATTVVPRLVSVVEIIKREYLKKLEANHSSRLSGLHQYNEIGCLEDLGFDDDDSKNIEEDRMDALAMSLDGKNFVKQKQRPFMRVTLCQIALPELVEKGATYQPPMMRKLSKSAKARAKKRERKAKEPEDTIATPA